MTADLAARMDLLERNWPGWHVWADSGGRLNAVCASYMNGCGCTLDAPDCLGLNRAIADAEASRAGRAA